VPVVGVGRRGCGHPTNHVVAGGAPRTLYGCGGDVGGGRRHHQGDGELLPSLVVAGSGEGGGVYGLARAAGGWQCPRCEWPPWPSGT